MPGDKELQTIIGDTQGTELLVTWAEKLGQSLKQQGLATNQIRALFGEVRQIQGAWSIEGQEEQAERRLILLKPKMVYRARKERGKAVEFLVKVLYPAVDLVTGAPNDQKKAYFQRFVDFFEAILAYHRAHGGR